MSDILSKETVYRIQHNAYSEWGNVLVKDEDLPRTIKDARKKLDYCRGFFRKRPWVELRIVKETIERVVVQYEKVYQEKR